MMKNNINNINKFNIPASALHATLNLRTVFTSASCSNLQIDTRLNPWFVTGFVDAEGCFSVGVIRSNKVKTGWEVQPTFKLELHLKDLPLLEQTQVYLGGAGSITKQGKDKVMLRVRSLAVLPVIVANFDKFPLVTQKRADFELFKRVLEAMGRKEHLTPEGLQNIVNMRASINNGLSAELKAAFPNTVAVPRPLVVDSEIKDPNWLAGFAAGEGCFLIDVYKAKTKIGYAVTLRFKLSQHSRDTQLMESLVEYLGCGAYYSTPDQNVGDFVVKKFLDLTEKIIPFFTKYPLQGVKTLDFEDFKKAAEVMKNKEHLTESGLEQIRLVQMGMNRGRQ